MTRPDKPTIWALVAEAANTLPEPFSAARLIDYVSRRRPDVAEASIRTHINYALVETTRSGPWASREPFLERVDRGLYRRHRGGTSPVASPPVARPATPAVAPRVDAGPRQTSRVLLVGCSRTKARDAGPAGELFQGPGFRRARDYAVRSGDSWYVLSAKYGLLAPDDVVGPYDVYLKDQPQAYRSAWGEWVVAQLRARQSLDGVSVEVHASEAYCTPLLAPLRRLGATVEMPLAGLGQGRRLAWEGYREHLPPAPVECRPALDRLLDPSGAVPPAEFLAAGPAGREVPGLYTWWVDGTGARDLATGMGHPVNAGLLYAGKAGGHRSEAAPSSSTLWGRIAGNHLHGNTRSSTLRKSLAAVLGAEGEPISEADLTAWMHAHLRVACASVASEQVGALEDELVSRARPPLNLMGLPRDEARSALTRLRGLLRRPSGKPSVATNDDSDAREIADMRATTDSGSTNGLHRQFERRLRSDLDQIVRTGYRPTVFQRMLAEHGAVQTAKRLLAATQLSDGFRHLWEHRLLHLSVENAVLDPQYEPLFAEEERGVARERLARAGFL